MDIEKCLTCKGRRKLSGMGGMDRDCPTCNGIGIVKIEEIEVPKQKQIEVIKQYRKTKQLFKKAAKQMPYKRLKTVQEDVASD